MQSYTDIFGRAPCLNVSRNFEIYVQYILDFKTIFYCYWRGVLTKTNTIIQENTESKEGNNNSVAQL